MVAPPGFKLEGGDGGSVTRLGVVVALSLMSTGIQIFLQPVSAKQDVGAPCRRQTLVQSSQDEIFGLEYSSVVSNHLDSASSFSDLGKAQPAVGVPLASPKIGEDWQGSNEISWNCAPEREMETNWKMGYTSDMFNMTTNFPFGEAGSTALNCYCASAGSHVAAAAMNGLDGKVLESYWLMSPASSLPSDDAGTMPKHEHKIVAGGDVAPNRATTLEETSDRKKAKTERPHEIPRSHEGQEESGHDDDSGTAKLSVVSWCLIAEAVVFSIFAFKL
ncbi:hypothetical protein MKZ38_001131 [Zalerion maritima]|uniref:Uncharacterized protein n=1 Tax=Zalerion maritima TaxID=339359 RepID=A0AAD5RRS6_9PEZI|nr:hypothetical protein MKZ38_001131 [Zalerion maritima]